MELCIYACIYAYQHIDSLNMYGSYLVLTILPMEKDCFEKLRKKLTYNFRNNTVFLWYAPFLL